MTGTGTFICYVPKKFRQEQLELLQVIDKITNDYEAQGYTLTVRQLYYQLVARGLIENTPKSYDRVQALISEGRLAGLISWTAYEDRGRNLMGLHTQTSPQSAIRAVRDSYRIDKWRTQRFRPEVWVEKAALESVVGEICNKMQVDFFACRGYNSSSEQWSAGQRFARYVQKGQIPLVLHLGDHDPSGIDMTRDNHERLSMFAGVKINVVRIALNMSQVEQYNPPPNPAKVTDSRAADYISKYGDESWELDALEPQVIHRLIEAEILKVRDSALWDEALAEEAAHLQELDLAIESMGGYE
jgi:hypothetical protein